jgi:hypothetical protein
MHWFPSFLLYGGEIWTLRQRDKKRLTSVEIKLFDHKRNEEILEEMKVE